MHTSETDTMGLMTREIPWDKNDVEIEKAKRFYQKNDELNKRYRKEHK